jgi:cyclopropane-fatty-acyl-phospholipid synthase
MEVADRCLKADGVAVVVHTIAGNREAQDFNAWYDKYIFTNAVIPSLSQLTCAAEGLFVIEDAHNIVVFTTTSPSWPGTRTSSRRGRS